MSGEAEDWTGVDAALDYLESKAEGSVLPALDLTSVEPPGLIMLPLPRMKPSETDESVAKYISLRVGPLRMMQRVTATRVVAVLVHDETEKARVKRVWEVAMTGVRNVVGWIVAEEDRPKYLVKTLRDYGRTHMMHLPIYINLFSTEHPWDVALALATAVVQDAALFKDSYIVAGLRPRDKHRPGKYLCLSRLASWLATSQRAALVATVGMVTTDRYIGQFVPFAAAVERALPHAGDRPRVLKVIRSIAGGGPDDGAPYDAYTYALTQHLRKSGPKWGDYETCLASAEARLEHAVGNWTPGDVS